MAKQSKAEALAAISRDIARNQTDGMTFRQLFIDCRKPKCKQCRSGPSHGPYWYSETKVREKVRTVYLGRDLPHDVASYVAQAHWVAPQVMAAAQEQLVRVAAQEQAEHEEAASWERAQAIVGSIRSARVAQAQALAWYARAVRTSARALAKKTATDPPCEDALCVLGQWHPGDHADGRRTWLARGAELARVKTAERRFKNKESVLVSDLLKGRELKRRGKHQRRR